MNPWVPYGVLGVVLCGVLYSLWGLPQLSSLVPSAFDAPANPAESHVAKDAQRATTRREAIHRSEIEASTPSPERVSAQLNSALRTSLLPQLPASASRKHVIDALKPYADAGNTKAACTVAAALDACRQALDANSADNTASSALANPYQCADVTPALMAEAAKYLLASAQAGNVNAMVYFASAPPLSEQDFGLHLDGWRLYKDHAQSFLAQGIQAGNIEALYYAYFLAVSGYKPGGIALVEHNAYTAMMYGTALRGLMSPENNAKLETKLRQLQQSAELDAVRLNQAVVEGTRLREGAYRLATPQAELSYGVPERLAQGC
jgi:hypothetical protein